MKVYIDTADWWVGYYRGPNHHYICPLPTVVIRLKRILDRADDKIQHGMGFGGYDPNGLPFWLADAILASDWLAKHDADLLAPIKARIEESRTRSMAGDHEPVSNLGLDILNLIDTPAQADGGER